MKLSVLKKKIIKAEIEFNIEVGMNISEAREFKKQIKLEMDDCDDAQDIINLLGQYGYDDATDYVLSFLVSHN
jgi:hypothetical protein